MNKLTPIYVYKGLFTRQQTTGTALIKVEMVPTMLPDPKIDPLTRQEKQGVMSGQKDCVVQKIFYKKMTQVLPVAIWVHRPYYECF